MVFMLDMGQLMDDNIIDGLIRVHHKPPGEADPIFRGTATEAFHSTGNCDTGRDEAHNFAVKGDFLGQDIRGLTDIILLFIRGGFGMLIAPGFLDGEMFIDPICVFLHEGIDIFLRKPKRGTDEDPAVSSDFEGEGTAAGS